MFNHLSLKLVSSVHPLVILIMICQQFAQYLVVLVKAECYSVWGERDIL